MVLWVKMNALESMGCDQVSGFIQNQELYSAKARQPPKSARLMQNGSKKCCTAHKVFSLPSAQITYFGARQRESATCYLGDCSASMLYEVYGT
jgi:hypothetical protein